VEVVYINAYLLGDVLRHEVVHRHGSNKHSVSVSVFLQTAAKGETILINGFLGTFSSNNRATAPLGSSSTTDNFLLFLN
jgi:hypothetical protein